MRARGAFPAAILVVLAAPSLRADLRIAIRESYGSTVTQRTEYFKNDLWRRDSESGNSYSVFDRIRNRVVTVNPGRREYSVYSPVQRVSETDPSRTIVVDIKARDTGEHRTMFGHVARHFIAIQRRTDSSNGPKPIMTETVTDGWYLDMAVPGAYRGGAGAVAVYSLVAVDQHNRQLVPKVEINRQGPSPHGLVVQEKTADRVMEITELSESALDDGLFEVPSGFRRVIKPLQDVPLSWSDWFLFGWQEVRDWFAGLF